MAETIVGMESPQKRPGLTVLFGGLVTTAAALAAVLACSLASDGKIQLMGFYLKFIIPVSAIVVGCLAGSGYSLVSWLRGIRVPNRILVPVALLMVAGYCTGQYIEYRVVTAKVGREDVSFVQYFDFTTRNLTFTNTRTDKEPEPLGGQGYLVRVAEIAGFTLGGIVPLLLLRVTPFCPACQRYKKNKALCEIPAAAARKVAKKDPRDVAAFEAEQHAALEQAQGVLAQLVQDAQKEDAEAFKARATALPKVKGKESPLWLEVGLTYCGCCGEGELTVAQATKKGDSTSRQQLAPVPVPSGFVVAYLGSRIQSRPSPLANADNPYAGQRPQ